MKNHKKERIAKSITENINEIFPKDIKKSVGLKKSLEKILLAVKPLDFSAIVKSELSNEKFKAEEISDLDSNYSNTEIAKISLKDSHYIVICIEKIIEISKQENLPLCRSDNVIYIYNGCYHESIQPENFKYFLGEVADKMKIPKFKGRFHKFKEELYRQFLSAAYFENFRNDNKSVLINLKNGTLKVCPEEKILKDFESEDFLKYQLDFEFNSEATSPIFFKFLDEVLPDRQKQTVLAEYCGYIFTKKNFINLEKMLLLLGSGSNGKSVFFEIFSAVLGAENVSNCSMKELSMENFRPEIEGKLLNYCSELSPNFDVEIFKKLASGEPIYAKKVYENAYRINDYAKMIFNCNDLPKITENTRAFFRRFLIIHFDVTISKDRMNFSLAKNIIAEELPGVLNWMLLGLDRLQKNNMLSFCKASDEILDMYEKENDSIILFIEEFRYCHSATNSMKSKFIYSQYKDFCIESGYRPLDALHFSRSLVEKKFKKTRRSDGNYYFIQILDAYEE